MTSKVQGYSSGGKTGTAEKFPRGNGKYVVSFIGFAPVDDPQVLIYVVIDEPNVEGSGQQYLSTVCGTGNSFRELPYMNIQPDQSNTEGQETTQFETGDDVTIYAEYKKNEDVKDAYFEAPSSRQNLPQIVTHILQKVFFKHALNQKKER